MRRFWGTMLCIAAVQLTATRSIGAQLSGVDTVRAQVRTVATALRHVVPNLAIVTLNVLATGSSPREAGRHLSARVDSLRRALTSLGVPRDSLLTASDWYWSPGRMEILVTNGRLIRLAKVDSAGRLAYNLQDTTYRAHDAIEVRIRETGKIGAIIDSALAHGISEISPIRFENSDLSDARDQALREATANAKRQADAIATSSGMRLGRVLSFSTYNDVNRYSDSDFGLEASMATSNGVGEGGTQVIPQSIPVSMTVYGRWELLPKQ